MATPTWTALRPLRMRSEFAALAPLRTGDFCDFFRDEQYLFAFFRTISSLTGPANGLDQAWHGSNK
jgi:hypothetical protein